MNAIPLPIPRAHIRPARQIRCPSVGVVAVSDNDIRRTIGRTALAQHGLVIFRNHSMIFPHVKHHLRAAPAVWIFPGRVAVAYNVSVYLQRICQCRQQWEVIIEKSCVCETEGLVIVHIKCAPAQLERFTGHQRIVG